MNTNFEYQVYAPNEFGGAGAISIFGSLFTYSLDDAQRAARGHKGAYVVRRILGAFGEWEGVPEAVQPAVNSAGIGERTGKAYVFVEAVGTAQERRAVAQATIDALTGVPNTHIQTNGLWPVNGSMFVQV